MNPLPPRFRTARLAAFSLGLTLALALSGVAVRAQPQASPQPQPWAGEADILARIQAPVFPTRDFVITDYGAVPGGTVSCTEAIGKAITACHDAGGGRVLVPPGVFLTGAIHLLSNVNLHVSAGATLSFSTDPAAYLPVVRTRWEGVECLNYSALIYAYGQENIAVTGPGTLDGNASSENWWAWAQRDASGKAPAKPDAHDLNAKSDAGVPPDQRIFGGGHFLRPNFFQPYRCRNVLIDGPRIRRSPMWEVNPVLCTNVIVRNLDICSLGTNNDGCDPECCTDVLIEGCSFQTGDDCIAIKSGRNEDGRRINVPSRNLIIRKCQMKDGHGGVVIGSEISGGCSNVFVEDCTMDSPHLERLLRFKSNAVRGGIIENVFARNITVGQLAEAVVTIDFQYEGAVTGPHLPTVRNVWVENVTCRKTPRIFNIAGIPGGTADDIHIVNCSFHNLDSTEILEHAGRIFLENVTAEPATKSKSLSSRAAAF